MYLEFTATGKQSQDLIGFLHIDPQHLENDVNTKVFFHLREDGKTLNVFMDL
jgi:hypothetical protein